MYGTMYSDELYHFGIKGQKWGVRRFQNKDGTRTAAGKKRELNAQRNKKLENVRTQASHITNKSVRSDRNKLAVIAAMNIAYYALITRKMNSPALKAIQIAGATSALASTAYMDTRLKDVDKYRADFLEKNENRINKKYDKKIAKLG